MIEAMTENRAIQAAVEKIPAELKAISQGTGAQLPPAMEGLTVLDLGCGDGRLSHIAAQLVGESGKVIGIDTDVEAAKKNAADNIEFKAGELTDLAAAGIEEGSIDLIISNCGIFGKGCPQAIMGECWKALKEGGELYITERFVNHRLAEKCEGDFADAVYSEDYRRYMNKVGWIDFRYMDAVKAGPTDIEGTEYCVRTIRAFKLPDYIEDICEQYGQFATYEGGIEGMAQYFDLDDHHRFFTDVPMSVCGNSCCYVENTRYGKYFKIDGNRENHVGPFSGCGKCLEPREPELIMVAKC